MTLRRRVKLSEQQRNDMWRRWKAGQSLHEIGRVFGKDHVCIQFMLAQHGGIAPAVRRRSLLTLTLAERDNISRGIACGSSIREIARGLQRAVSTVSREIARHGERPQYRATVVTEKGLRPSPVADPSGEAVWSDRIECPCGPIFMTDSGILSDSCPLLHSPFRTSLLRCCADCVLEFKSVTSSLGVERLMKRMNLMASHFGGFSSGASLGGKLTRYGGKESIYTQGAPADSLFYILKGGVRLTTRSKYHRSAVTAILGVGDFFGELCLVGLRSCVELDGA